MSSGPSKECQRFEALLVKKITGNLPSNEENSLGTHLEECALCAAEERSLAVVWQGFDSVPVPDLPPELRQTTREAILEDLKRKRAAVPWIVQVHLRSTWAAFVAFAAGLALVGISYGLIRGLIDPAVHHHYILVPLLGLWWLLFTGTLWLMFEGKRITSTLDLVSAGSVSIALLTLIIAFLAHQLDFLRWPAMFASYRITAAADYFFGIGNTFAAAWWVHCCLASFAGAFLFGFSRPARSTGNLLLGALIATILLSPAIYLQGASHNHSLGLIAFAALGTYVGSLVGTGMGLLFRRRFSFQTA